MKKTVLSLFIACCCLTACDRKSTTAQVSDYNVIPLPQEITMKEGAGFELNGNTVIAYGGNDALKRNAELLAVYIKESTGLELQIAEGEATQGNTISLVTDNVTGNDEGYRLTVANDGIKIAAPSPAGVFYGIQTLRKSLPAAACKKVESDCEIFLD